MTHLPFIVAAYVIALGTPIILTVQAVLRARSAERRLDAIDPRRNRGNL
jgi:heme exporter protein D